MVHVSHTIPSVQRLTDIRQPRPEPTPTEEDQKYMLDKFLWKRGGRYQFLKLMNNEKTHDSKWQPTSEFLDEDTTLNFIRLDYIQKNDILPMFHEKILKTTGTY